MRFTEGTDVPGEFLALKEPNVRIQLQIISEAGKLPIIRLLNATGDRVDEPWRNRFAQLFKNLGFDNDTKEVAQSGSFAGRHFTSEELVANLIDYMDIGTDSYSASGFAQGIESQLSRNEPFRNEKIDSLASELGSIPGFTPARVQRLIPLLTATATSRININAAPKDVIRALDPNLDDATAQKVVDFRNPASGGGFTAANRTQQLRDLLGPVIGDEVQRVTDVTGTWYEVIAKVDYNTSYFMARAILKSSGPGRLPIENNLELY
jgi:type II secretory pathway component PulK